MAGEIYLKLMCFILRDDSKLGPEMREDPDLSAERRGDVPSMKTSLQDTGR